MALLPVSPLQIQHTGQDVLKEEMDGRVKMKLFFEQLKLGRPSFMVLNPPSHFAKRDNTKDSPLGTPTNLSRNLKHFEQSDKAIRPKSTAATYSNQMSNLRISNSFEALKSASQLSKTFNKHSEACSTPKESISQGFTTHKDSFAFKRSYKSKISITLVAEKDDDGYDAIIKQKSQSCFSSTSQKRTTDEDTQMDINISKQHFTESEKNVFSHRKCNSGIKSRKFSFTRSIRETSKSIISSVSPNKHDASISSFSEDDMYEKYVKKSGNKKQKITKKKIDCKGEKQKQFYTSNLAKARGSRYISPGQARPTIDDLYIPREDIVNQITSNSKHSNKKKIAKQKDKDIAGNVHEYFFNAASPKNKKQKLMQDRSNENMYENVPKSIINKSKRLQGKKKLQ